MVFRTLHETLLLAVLFLPSTTSSWLILAVKALEGLQMLWSLGTEPLEITEITH